MLRVTLQKVVDESIQNKEGEYEVHFCINILDPKEAMLIVASDEESKMRDFFASIVTGAARQMVEDDDYSEIPEFRFYSAGCGYVEAKFEIIGGDENERSLEYVMLPEIRKEEEK